MALRELELDLSGKTAELPPNVVELIAEVERRSDVFYEKELHKTIPSIIPSNPAVQYAAIREVTEAGMVSGRTFCEWGSGFGTATVLAAMLGYEATGVEIESSLVEFSRELATDFEIGAEFLEVSYFPKGLDQFEGQGGSGLVSESDDLLNFGEPAEVVGERGDDFFYEGLEAPLSDIDLFFVYPYPRDQEMFLDLFDTVAGVDAVLITNFEDGEVGGFLKV